MISLRSPTANSKIYNHIYKKEVFSLHFLPFKRFIFTVKQTKGKSLFLYCQLLSLRFEVWWTIKSRFWLQHHSLYHSRSTQNNLYLSLWRWNRKIIENYCSRVNVCWLVDDLMTRWFEEWGELLFNVSSLHFSTPMRCVRLNMLRHLNVISVVVKIRSEDYNYSGWRWREVVSNVWDI